MTDFASSGLREASERTKGYIDDFIDQGRAHVLRKAVLDTTYLPHFEKLYEGKVRDMYICRDYVVIITTDRQSAFDRQLAEVPYKGQVGFSFFLFNAVSDSSLNFFIILFLGCRCSTSYHNGGLSRVVHCCPIIFLRFLIPMSPSPSAAR